MAGLNHHGSVALIRRRLLDSIDSTRELLESECVGQAAVVAAKIADALANGGKVLFFGNGGSAMEAGHLAGELLGRFGHDRAPLPAISLSDNTAAMTAIGNDYGYGTVFTRLVRGLGRPGDVLVGLTTSGDSQNVVDALLQGRELGMFTVALTGRKGGAVTEAAEVCIQVPADDTPRVQEACLHLGHTICELVETEMFCSGPAVRRAGKGRP